MTGEPSFFEIGVPDAERAERFYSALFGWRTHRTGGGARLETAGIRGGVHPGDSSATIGLYFRVDDIEAAAERVRELGGTAGDPGEPSPGFGRFTACRDDQGVYFGLHQPE
ncbi:hypothetical protein LX16_4499 [Stackebrandtia albiflava]|uniref:VOC domain-containing protein n=1 Tax=Stackebrandtia albiflava TaxID=406432 RepID=A0A562URN5_9ACTN|nr:VOC family protein [Stackebrandtia albiflava]TWJ08274.1 hypothetical protein LX16_4499 [Stackebrandtia albiflava]